MEVRYPPPPQKGYLSDIGAIPYENKANGCDTPLCDTISKRYCAIRGGISHWASKLRDGETTIKIKFSLFEGGGGLGAERKTVQNAAFRGKRHDNKILKVQILLSRNFVVIAQAPISALAI